MKIKINKVKQLELQAAPCRDGGYADESPVISPLIELRPTWLRDLPSHLWRDTGPVQSAEGPKLGKDALPSTDGTSS